MTVDQSVATQPFSVAMRVGSQAEHSDAENSGYMSQLTSGNVNEEGYAALLLRLRMVYEALESTASRLAGETCVDAVLDPALSRLDTIDADLDHWVGTGDRVVDSPAAEAYRDRVLATTEWAPLFVAHHYTRYLGDLSGGQVVGRLLNRTFSLDGKGVSFYSFDQIPKPKPYKDSYRARLDQIGAGLDQAGRDRVVAEVKAAFRLNKSIFDELGANLDSYRR